MVPAADHQQGYAWAHWQGATRLRMGGYVTYLILLTLIFVSPLLRLISYAAHSDLYSYILLVPCVAAWLLQLKRGQLSAALRTSITGTVTVGAIGLAAVALWFRWRHSLSLNDELALIALAYVILVAAGGFLFLGPRWMASAAFPITFLTLIVPLPGAATAWLEDALRLASADAAGVYFGIAGTAVVRHGTAFELPSIVISVARECSGIHSTWVLFITSLLASHLFLRTRWRRIALVAFILPLGILRNGLRILVIGLLCVHFGPQMIDSDIHRHGGPIFFAVSLIPLGLFGWWLRRQERRSDTAAED
jgi:exosortase C (VPDSG-CTERM-specific)